RELIIHDAHAILRSRTALGPTAALRFGDVSRLRDRDWHRSALLGKPRLRRAHERAHELAIDLFRERLDVEARAGEECRGVSGLVDAGRLDARVLEADRGEKPQEFLLF